MRSIIIILIVFVASYTSTAQNKFEIKGTVKDSTGQLINGSKIKLVTEKGDSSLTITDVNGRFIFESAGGNIMLIISALGYQTTIKKYALINNSKLIALDPIVLKQQPIMLNQVTIVGVNPVTFKKDTIEYKTSAYKVKENAALEEVIKKLPGVDVDANGNITAQGKAVTKVRVNGKDFFGGDVQAATKNLPADIVENIQIIDDYGEKANLTGVKTGDPTKLMNITIRQDRNHGHTGQITIGDGSDALPRDPNVTNDNRYIGLLNVFNFKGDQQISLLGNINNTNVNTFSFGTPLMTDPISNKKLQVEAEQTGKSNSGSFVSQSSIQNGITNTSTVGTNFRDQWGKKLSVYGSYSFSDNTTFTQSTTLQQTSSSIDPGSISQNSEVTSNTINHRFNWNMDYKPDTINYLKIAPSFSYSRTIQNNSGDLTSMRNGILSAAYSSTLFGRQIAPDYGLTGFFNHRFKKPGNNFSIDISLRSASRDQFQNPIYTYTAGSASSPLNQMINTNTKTHTYNSVVSYLKSLSPSSFVELNYTFNRTTTADNKQTDVLDAGLNVFKRDNQLSNHYTYSFSTNTIALNYRYIQKSKYNYTIGLGVQPALLDGHSALTGASTHVSTFNIVPSAYFSYNFSKSQTLNFNYSGTSNQPDYLQMQPVIDLSNALYPVQGNPNLKPSFTNNIGIRYNQFDFTKGDILFTNLSLSQTKNQVVTNTVIYPASYAPDPRLQNTYLTRFINGNGNYTASGFISYIKPWDKRKYTLLFSGAAAYTNTHGYLTTVDLLNRETTQQNTARNLILNPGLRFRVDIQNLVDMQLITNYVISKTNNSIKNSLTEAASNTRTWNIGLNGKNYLKSWTLSYDFNKAINYGYAQSIQVNNPTTLNMYIEREFLKGKAAAFRLSGFDVFNQNTGFTSYTTASSITQSNTNRLGRYFLASFTLRLQKFSGK